MILKIIIGIVLLIVVMNVILISKRKGFYKKLKTAYIGDSLNKIKNNLGSNELIFDELEIQNHKYLIVKSRPKRTIKVFEFDKDICTGFYIKSTEMVYSLANNFNYEKGFEIIENNNFFNKGIDTSETSRNIHPNYLSNGLFIKLNDRIGKIYKSIPSNETKYRPLFIFVIHQSESGLNNFIEKIKNELSQELFDFNDDKMEIKLW